MKSTTLQMTMCCPCAMDGKSLAVESRLSAKAGSWPTAQSSLWMISCESSRPSSPGMNLRAAREALRKTPDPRRFALKCQANQTTKNTNSQTQLSSAAHCLSKHNPNVLVAYLSSLQYFVGCVDVESRHWRRSSRRQLPCTMIPPAYACVHPSTAAASSLASSSLVETPRRSLVFRQEVSA